MVGGHCRRAIPNLAPEDTFPNRSNGRPGKSDARNAVSLRAAGFMPQSGSRFHTCAIRTIELPRGRLGPPNPVSALVILVGATRELRRDFFRARKEIGIMQGISTKDL